jgi:carbon storage regulator
MLVLKRALNQHILIDGDIRITILGIEGQRVKIGVQAPAHIQILRGELVGKAQPDPGQEPEHPPLSPEG